MRAEGAFTGGDVIQEQTGPCRAGYLQPSRFALGCSPAAAMVLYMMIWRLPPV